MHVGGHHGSPPCSPTRATTHHKLHMKKESRQHNHHTYHAHNRHKTDASQKNGWGKHGGEYLRGNEYRATRARCCVECRTLNTHLSTVTYVCGCPASLKSCNRRANKHSRVCCQQCVLSHTLVWVWGRAQLFARVNKGQVHRSQQPGVRWTRAWRRWKALDEGCRLAMQFRFETFINKVYTSIFILNVRFARPRLARQQNPPPAC